jgi:predicted PurR-regulated permease PerM
VSYFFAFLLNPVVSYFDKRGIGRAGPSGLLLSVFFAFLLLFLILLVPKLITQVREFMDHAPLLVSSVTALLAPYSIQYFGYDIFSDWQKFVQDMLPRMNEIPATMIVGNLFSGTLQALGALASVLIVPILTFYMLKDYSILNSKFLGLVPRRFVGTVAEVTHRLSIVLGNLVRGQFLVCLILATFYSIALAGIGLKMSMVIGIFAGALNLIPFVGPLAAMGVAILVCLIGGGNLMLCAGIVGVFLVANLVESTILTPKIIGKQMGISPLTIILVLLAGAELLGVLGMLLALPVTAGVKVLGGFLLERYFSSQYYKNPINSNE